MERTWIPYRPRCRPRGGSASRRAAARRKQSIKATQSHLWDMVPAASSADSRLPGSLNVGDLSVSISQLISLVHLAAASAAHSFCSSVSTCSHRPGRIYKDNLKPRDRRGICGARCCGVALRHTRTHTHTHTRAGKTVPASFKLFAPTMRVFAICYQ